MGVFTLLSSLVSSFGLLLILRAIAGAGASVIFPNVNATLGDNFPYRERGRAISTVIAFNTMASVIGIPIAGIVAEATSWRVSLALVGLLAVAAATLLLFQLKPAQVHVNESRVFELYRTILGNRSAVAAVISSLLGGLYWFHLATYLVVFFQDRFGLSEGAASTWALTMGLGVLVGSQVGGRIGDRYGHRPVVASAIVVSGSAPSGQTNVGLPLLVTSALKSRAVGRHRRAIRDELDASHRTGARGARNASRALRCDRKSQHRRWRGRRGLLIDLYGFWAVGVFCLGAALLRR